MKNLFKYILLVLPFICFCQQGNVGINTSNPQEKLHIKSTVRFEPTNPDYPVLTDYTLVSDNQGNANWKNINLTKTSILGNYSTTVYSKTQTFSAYTPGTVGTTFRSTGTSITLPKGKWLIVLSMGTYVEMKYPIDASFHPLEEGKSIWLRSTLSDNNLDETPSNSSASSDLVNGIYSSVSIVGPNKNGLVTGEFFINQQSNSPKTYYLKYNFDFYSTINNTQVRISNFGISPQIIPENFIVAYPMNF